MARYWSISAVPVSVHPSPLVITTKLVTAILVVAVVRRRVSASPVLPLWLSDMLAVVCVMQHLFTYLLSQSISMKLARNFRHVCANYTEKISKVIGSNVKVGQQWP